MKYLLKYIKTTVTNVEFEALDDIHARQMIETNTFPTRPTQETVEKNDRKLFQTENGRIMKPVVLKD